MESRPLRRNAANLALARAAAAKRLGQRGVPAVVEQKRWAVWLARLLLMTLLIVSLVVVLVLLSPHLHAIILAVLLSSLFHPVHQWIHKRVKQRRNLSAFLSVALVFIILLVPIGWFTSAVIQQAFTTVDAANRWISEGKLQQTLSHVNISTVMAYPAFVPIKPALEHWLEVSDLSEVDLSNSKVTALISNVGRRLMGWTAEHIQPLLTGGGRLVIGFGIMLFVMFFCFRDGTSVMNYIKHLSPLTRTQEDAMLQRIRDVSRAVVFGTGLTAIAQGLAAMIAFYFVGIPALFWGTVLAAASIVPIVGTALVWVPAVGYLCLNGRFGAAAFLAAWCMLVVSSIDNFLRPVLMGGRVGMSAVVIFFSIVGGLQFFGPVGVIYGPLIFGLCAVCLYIYEFENAEFLDQQERL